MGSAVGGSPSERSPLATVADWPASEYTKSRKTTGGNAARKTPKAWTSASFQLVVGAAAAGGGRGGGGRCAFGARSRYGGSVVETISGEADLRGAGRIGAAAWSTYAIRWSRPIEHAQPYAAPSQAAGVR